MKLTRIQIIVFVLITNVNCTYAQQYIQNNTSAKNAWDKLRKDVGIKSADDFRNKQFIFHQPPTIHKLEISNLVDSGKTYKFTDLADGIELLIKAKESTQTSEAYTSDLVLLIRQTLANLGYTVFTRMIDSYSKKNVRKFVKHAADFIEIAIDIDMLTGSNLHLKYLPQWKGFIELTKESLLTNKPLSKQEIEDFRNNFHPELYKTKLSKLNAYYRPNTSKTAIMLFEKYKFHLISNFYGQPDTLQACNRVSQQENINSFAQNQTKFIGNVSNDRPDDSYKEIWNQVTPENTTKWQLCEPNDNRWTLERSKGIYDYCKQNGLKFKFHTLVWGAQYPLWVDSLKTDAELKMAMEEWFRKAGETFPEADFVDVVNEPLFGHEAPFFRRAIGSMYDFYGTGWDWVIWSFEQARIAFPNSKLLINDFNILKNTHNIKRYSELISHLRKRNLIDGIGCQAHWIEKQSAREIKQGLDSLVALNPGLDIYISELEFNIESDEAQMQKMKEIFPVLWEHPAVKGITFWGYKRSWVGKNALLVRDGIDRPAMTWLKSYVSNFYGKQE